ncbi:MAG: ATP-binding domain-containing protein [Cyanobacteria bacterium P01_A01_bin.84]
MAFSNQKQGEKFITTEPINADINCGSEQQCWEGIKTSFSDRECIAYWRYPIFSKVGEAYREPDILVVDKKFGIVVVGIMAVSIDQIVAIEGENWKLQNFETTQINPLEITLNQLHALIAYCDRESALWRRVNGRAMIILPLITQEQWQQKGFTELVDSQNIIFQDQLIKEVLVEHIGENSPIVPGNNLEDKDWELLLSVLGGIPLLRKAPRNISTTGKTRSSVLDDLGQRLSALDLKQEHIGKEIPPGMQRIRGIAGSGKTLLLCQKAAHMHLKHPDWDIALVFFTRSLYDLMIGLVDKWIRRLSGGEMHYNPNTNKKLQVLHAWGAASQAGLYGTVCEYHNKQRWSVANTKEKQPTQALAELCKRLQEETVITPIFDAILIDEGQDLVAQGDLKYQDKQAIYWLAYQALRPVSKDTPQEKRLIWAYDEAQSLDSPIIPKAKELFGEELSNIFSQNPQYPGGIKRSEVMRHCYRTPGEIITAAHAIAMGLLRPEGMLSGITNKQDWDKIGYQVEGDFRRSGSSITIHRPPKYSPNPIPELWGEAVLNFEIYPSREEELTALAENIMHNIVHDGLNLSRDILVIILGSNAQASELETQIAEYLIEQGINIYIPSAPSFNRLRFEWQDSQPNVFWHKDAVTVSRVPRAKGNEANMVYVVGFENIARNESDINLRNQLFVALTRSRGWANLSGVGNYPMYNEMQAVIESGDTFTFTYKRPPKRDIGDG